MVPLTRISASIFAGSPARSCPATSSRGCPRSAGRTTRCALRPCSLIEAELASSLSAHARKPGTRAEPQGLARLFSLARNRSSPQPRSDSIEDRERRLLAAWQRKAEGANDPLARAAYGVLVRLAGAILIQHGRLRGERTFLAALAAELTCNEHGSELIGRLIEPHVREAAAREGYRVVPAQPRPVVMNTKGASASGKSTMRPLQRQLAEELGLCWSDFAVISPDIWRKFLLDYGVARRRRASMRPR